MESAALTSALLILAASLASWLLSQWLLRRKRNAETGWTLGTAAVSCLLAAAGLAVLAFPVWSRLALPEVDLTTPMIAPAQAATENAHAQDTQRDSPAAAVTALADPGSELSRPVASSLRSAQTAIQRKDWQGALEHIAAAAAAPNRSRQDNVVIAQFFAYVHVQERNYVAAAAAAVERLRWLDSSSVDYLQQLKLAAQLQFASKLYGRVVEYGQQYLQAHGEDPEIRILIAQAQYLIGEHRSAENQIDRAITARMALQEEVPESWLLLRLASAQSSGDPRSAGQLRQALLQNHPEHARVLAHNSSRQREIVVSPEGVPPIAVTLLPGTNEQTHAASTQWPATECVRTLQAEAVRSISNHCNRPVGVLFAHCEYSSGRCNSFRAGAWSYDDGFVLAEPPRTSEDRSRDVDAGLDHTRRIADRSIRVRYLACFVSSAEAAGSIQRRHEIDPRQFRERLERAWRTDECLKRVARWVELGRNTGQSPDQLPGAAMTAQLPSFVARR